MNCESFSERARDRVVIQSKSLADTDLGGQVVTWGTENTVWAIIEPSSGREVFLQGQNESRVTHKFTIRYNATYKDTSTASIRRISFDGRIFPVKYIRNLHDDMKRHGKVYQEFYCEENSPDDEG